MRVFERKTLVVIGAGPKGIAVAVKAKVLEEFGLPVDRVILVEKSGVAANWSGEFGYTNGEMKLGTSPEKDVVFPLETEVGDSRLNDRIRRRLLEFTWVSFLIHTEAYSDWVDRGRPAPCHQQWACYLKWVSGQLAPAVSIVSAEVEKVNLSSDAQRWELILARGASPLMADRLMLTGPGKTRMEFLYPGMDSVTDGLYDIESFWAALKQGSFSAQGRIAVVGAGENAASVLLALRKKNPEIRVDVISPRGFIATRSENFYENRFYSQPEKGGWEDLRISDRMDFIHRTDLGVFSVHAMQILNEETMHRVVPGRMIGLQRKSDELQLTIEYRKQHTHMSYDQVILTTGSDQVATLKSFFSEQAIATIEAQLGSPLQQADLARRIGSDLSVQGVSPSLHLPMLAGLMQGPGFANLSCLGRLSDRILLDHQKSKSAYRDYYEEPIVFRG